MKRVTVWILSLSIVTWCAPMAVAEQREPGVDEDWSNADAVMDEESMSQAPATQPTAWETDPASTWRKSASNEDSYLRSSAEGRQFLRIPPTREFQGRSAQGSLAAQLQQNAPDIYGFREATEESEAAQSSGAVGGIIAEGVPQHASNNWGEAKNLVDDNFIQTRDQFDVPGDFYTKEWKITQPPLVAHTRFQTIYDDDLTSSYYTPWFGSPVTWAPNTMVQEAMPQATHEGLLTERQLVTYFTDWKNASTETTTPASLAWASASPANTYAATENADNQVYGYRGDDQVYGVRGNSDTPAGGVIHLGKRTLFWDDQDVIGPSATSAGPANADVYGYIAPTAGVIGETPGTRAPAGDVYLNIPRSTGVNIYGMPVNSSK